MFLYLSNNPYTVLVDIVYYYLSQVMTDVLLFLHNDISFTTVYHTFKKKHEGSDVIIKP